MVKCTPAVMTVLHYAQTHIYVGILLPVLLMDVKTVHAEDHPL